MDAISLILLVVAGVLFAFAAWPRFATYAVHFLGGGALALVIMMLVERL